ncbi:MAG: DUF1501 domain-containing protein, partial [Planctomycetaceae bacterium]
DPRSGGPSGAGRDHWTHCLTDVMAGGGLRGGQTYGSSDSPTASLTASHCGRNRPRCCGTEKDPSLHNRCV